MTSSGCEARAINLGNKERENRYFHWWYQRKIEKIFSPIFLDILQENMK